MQAKSSQVLKKRTNEVAQDEEPQIMVGEEQCDDERKLKHLKNTGRLENLKTVLNAKKSQRKVTLKKAQGDFADQIEGALTKQASSHFDKSKMKKKESNNPQTRTKVSNSKHETSYYQSSLFSVPSTDTTTQMDLEMKYAEIGITVDSDESKKLKKKPKMERKDDTLRSVDPVMPDMDLPSLTLNSKTD
ncbi:unnamed protein product [Thelazia callipaeda]|uniref:Ovule protein n=1 Tax=Thelazia callipaeda TaxID=103827 RepID=A0A0N5CKF8_THECL|nr:unnamed protein product [Thelazia callipaeda]